MPRARGTVGNPTYDPHVGYTGTPAPGPHRAGLSDTSHGPGPSLRHRTGPASEPAAAEDKDKVKQREIVGVRHTGDPNEVHIQCIDSMYQ